MDPCEIFFASASTAALGSVVGVGLTTRAHAATFSLVIEPVSSARHAAVVASASRDAQCVTTARRQASGVMVEDVVAVVAAKLTLGAELVAAAGVAPKLTLGAEVVAAAGAGAAPKLRLGAAVAAAAGAGAAPPKLKPAAAAGAGAAAAGVAAALSLIHI